MTARNVKADPNAVLQGDIELHLVRLYEDTNLYAIHVRRIAIMPKDVQHARCT